MDHVARRAGLALWIVFLTAGLSLYFFRHDWLATQLAALSSAPLAWVGALYLALGCLRAFTLVPATYLLLAGMLVLPPAPLLALTLVGILVSSTAVYRFAGAMGLASYFERRHPAQVMRLRTLLLRRELPVVIIWSFLPVAPTDVVCYVCGALGIDLKKCLLGVAIGEGTICALYVFFGAHALAWMGWLVH